MEGTHLRAPLSLAPPTPFCTLKVGGGLTGVTTVQASLELRGSQDMGLPGRKLGPSLANSLPAGLCPHEDVGTGEQPGPHSVPATYKEKPLTAKKKKRGGIFLDKNRQEIS